MYEGEWKDVIEHGIGTMTYFDGGVFEGEWNDVGYRHGKGKYSWPNGDVYEGGFRGDKINGEGTMKYEYAGQ